MLNDTPRYNRTFDERPLENVMDNISTKNKFAGPIVSTVD